MLRFHITELQNVKIYTRKIIAMKQLTFAVT